MRTHRHQAGVMLIEALIGILIFSFGILALLGMQGAAMKNTTDAKYRSEAAFLATQIAGQMWVDDKDKLARYNTADPTPYLPRDRWVTRVTNLLPGIATGTAPAPQIQVGPDPVAGLGDREVRVQVQWLQPGETQVRQVIILNHIHAGDGA